MKHVTTTFFRGLFTLLPVLLSVYVFIWFLKGVESLSSQLLLTFLPDALYVTGMGTLVVFVLIYAFGMIVDNPLTKLLINFVEAFFRGVPLIKTVYVAIKDFTEFLKPGQKNRANQVVVIRVPGSQLEMIGLMTRDSLKDLPAAVTKENRVAVYFPMSYQFGGYTMFVPREWIHPTNMPVEEAMRSIITAWLPGQASRLENI